MSPCCGSSPRRYSHQLESKSARTAAPSIILVLFSVAVRGYNSPLLRRSHLSRFATAFTAGDATVQREPSHDEVDWAEVTPRKLSESQKKVVAYRQKYNCNECKCLLPPSYEVDHILPLALGGTNGLSNLQALCPPCHTLKTRSQRHKVLGSTAARANAERSCANCGTSGVTLLACARCKTVHYCGRECQKSHWSAADGHKVVCVAVGDKRAPRASSKIAGIESTEGDVNGLELTPLRLLAGMNQQQLVAVTCSDGPTRVAAGPGTL